MKTWSTQRQHSIIFAISTESAGTRHPIFAVIGQKKMAAAKIGGKVAGSLPVSPDCMKESILLSCCWACPWEVPERLVKSSSTGDLENLLFKPLLLKRSGIYLAKNWELIWRHKIAWSEGGQHDCNSWPMADSVRCQLTCPFCELTSRPSTIHRGKLLTNITTLNS